MTNPASKITNIGGDIRSKHLSHVQRSFFFFVYFSCKIDTYWVVSSYEIRAVYSSIIIGVLLLLRRTKHGSVDICDIYQQEPGSFETSP
jgi:hypothetical protein